MKKKLLNDFLLYLILDREVLDYASLLNVAHKAIKAGIDIIQLRDKIGLAKNTLSLAIKLRKLTKDFQAIFIVNDRIDLALLSHADGVHLGQDDIPLTKARSLLGKEKIIGISCHNLKESLIAQKEGANYIGLGPVFSTQTKPGFKPIGLDIISKIKIQLKIPIFAIGGMTVTNITQVLDAGASNIAVCRAICWQRGAFKATKALKKILTHSATSPNA
ncbi:MAG: thiamine phosphate synthase [Candidatus Omnitrophota bacterium]|nr:thiamine phosphate synthase [Candidatus Omnitrophota bacterium]